MHSLMAQINLGSNHRNRKEILRNKTTVSIITMSLCNKIHHIKQVLEIKSYL